MWLRTISGHIARANNMIDFDNPKILGHEHEKKSREIKEAKEIKRGDKTTTWRRAPSHVPTF